MEFAGLQSPIFLWKDIKNATKSHLNEMKNFYRTFPHSKRLLTHDVQAVERALL